MRILLEAPILTKSGYGEHARLVYKALKKRKGLDIMIDPLAWGTTSWSNPNKEILESIQNFGRYVQHCRESQQNPKFDIQIHVGIPSEFEKKAPYSVCVTAGIETDRVSANWLIKTHQGIDKIIVPSEHAKSGFERASCEVINQENNTKTEIRRGAPIEVVPYPVKTPSGPPLDIEFETDFNFLSIAMMGPRKNLETTIEGFVEQFRDNPNVGLIIKTSLSRSSIMDREQTKKQIDNLVGALGEKKCKVYLIHGDLTESEIHSLYTHPKVKAYVTTTHGEGYGLRVFEAAYSGLPVIATDWSGHLDFLSADFKGKNKKLFARVDCDIKEVQKEALWKDLIGPECKWAYVKKLSYKTQLEKVYNNHGMYNKWAEVLRAEVLQNHKEEDILDKYLVSIFGTTEDLNEKAISELRTEALAIENVKERAKFAKEVVSGDISQTEKIEFLKDLFKGEKAYVLSCGPTLTDHDPQKVKDILNDNLGVAIKQSFDLFGEGIDFHIYNCANFKEYDYSKSAPIVIEATSTPYRLGQCDLKFFIQEREFNNSVAATGDFESWTFEKQPLLRPYGPGIMYEAVFYALQHIGVSEIITIGWDNKLIEGDASRQHFYDKVDSIYSKEDFIHDNEVAKNTSAVEALSYEADIAAKTVASWLSWFKLHGMTLKIISSINPAPDYIERIEI